MTFETAVRATPDIKDCFRDGLRAVKNQHRRCLGLKKGRGLSWAGSVDLDSGLAGRYPDKPRWDYAVGVAREKASDRAAFVEVHPAFTSNVREVINKKEWLASWLAQSAPKLRAIAGAGFFWIATKGVHIQKHSPQFRQLAGHGIRVGERAEIT